MKIYLAARYSRRLELCGYKAQLESAGHVVTSRWLDGHHEHVGMPVSDEAAMPLRQQYAVEDYEDVVSAKCCISFTEESRTALTRGGRHVEFGIAYALHRRCIVVGHLENVFHCLPGVEFHPHWEEAFQSI